MRRERYEVRDKVHAKLPTQVPGVHLWVFVAMFQSARPEESIQVLLDRENLLTIEGPGCYWCEATYQEARNQPCPGRP